MLKKLLNNKIKFFVLFLLVLVLASIRIFEKSLFYDPFLDYFKADFTNLPLPIADKLNLSLSLFFRYFLNAIISVAFIQIAFKDINFTKFTFVLYGLLFVILILAFWIVLAFFADEEASGTYGSRWLVKNRPELFAGCSEAVSEVGGFSVTITGGHRLYLVEAAQKGIAWIKLSAKGTAGHGSFINRDNAVTKVSDAVSRIGNYQWPQLLTKTTSQFFKKIAELTGDKFDPKNVQPLLNHLGNAVKMLGATISNTANPTMLEAGYKANVIPQNASAVIDGRFLPGYENDLHETIKKLAGDEIEVEILTRDIALESEFAGPLVEAMSKAINVEDSAGIPVPYLMSGGTDNKALHDLGIVGYGFSPLRLPEDLDFFALFHGVDERVPIDGLKFGVRVLYEFLENI